MEIVQPTIEPKRVHGSLYRAMVAQPPQGVVDLGAVGDERAAITKGSKVLLDDEAGAHCIAQFTLLESISMRINGLRVVLDNPEPMLPRNGADRFHVRAMS